jgi:hypothetical protein
MSLQNGALHDLVDNILEIDSYKSKMGSDSDIVTLSFSTKTKESAMDLSSFLEKGYLHVLDSDFTTGEQTDGTYKVFVELEREDEVIDNIMEIANGVHNLTGLQDLQYRYYKSFDATPLTAESLAERLPLDATSYESQQVNESNLNNYTNFFNKSFVESVLMRDNKLVIHKKYADPVVFEYVAFGDTADMLESITESYDVNGFSEVIFLSKYIGDYNITKFGDKITLENEDKLLIVKRVQV